MITYKMEQDAKQLGADVFRDFKAGKLDKVGIEEVQAYMRVKWKGVTLRADVAEQIETIALRVIVHKTFRPEPVPNLQNIPVRTEDGDKIRRAFIDSKKT